jgi:hypothetical protein
MVDAVIALIVFFIFLLAFAGILMMLDLRNRKNASKEFLVKLRFANYRAHMSITVYAVDKEMAQLLANRLQKVMGADDCKVVL